MSKPNFVFVITIDSESFWEELEKVEEAMDHISEWHPGPHDCDELWETGECDHRDREKGNDDVDP